MYFKTQKTTIRHFFQITRGTALNTTQLILSKGQKIDTIIPYLCHRNTETVGTQQVVKQCAKLLQATSREGKWKDIAMPVSSKNNKL